MILGHFNTLLFTQLFVYWFYLFRPAIVKLESYSGLSDKEGLELYNQMQKKAQEFAQSGTVVMLELCQHAQVLACKELMCLLVAVLFHSMRIFIYIFTLFASSVLIFKVNNLCLQQIMHFLGLVVNVPSYYSTNSNPGPGSRHIAHPAVHLLFQAGR